MKRIDVEYAMGGQWAMGEDKLVNFFVNWAGCPNQKEVSRHGYITSIREDLLSCTPRNPGDGVQSHFQCRILINSGNFARHLQDSSEFNLNGKSRRELPFNDPLKSLQPRISPRIAIQRSPQITQTQRFPRFKSLLPIQSGRQPLVQTFSF